MLQRIFDRQKHIIISLSKDIFTNLAFEDYLYTSKEIKSQFIFLYINKPSVIVGRFQNIWKESNPFYLKYKNIKLARRKSGGGAVYHDEGNINLSFFSDRKNYNRKANLLYITKALDNLGIHTNLNEKDDIIINDKKISGTAAKLGQYVCYHHCTLLVESNLFNIRKSLNSLLESSIIDCKGSPSKKSSIINIRDINTKLSTKAVLNSLIENYLDAPHDKNVYYVNPNPQNFPGLEKSINEFKSWDWIYGKCPKFVLNTETSSITNSFGNIKMVVNQGCLQTLIINHMYKSNCLKYITLDLEKYKLCFTLSNLIGPIVCNHLEKLVNQEFVKNFKSIIYKQMCEKIL